jgi:hypothetical protein
MSAARYQTVSVAYAHHNAELHGTIVFSELSVVVLVISVGSG